MILELRRKKNNGDATYGELFIDGIFECYTLEDEPRVIKVMGETRIPAGEYKIKLQTNGELTKKYAKRFPGIHKGMLWLQDVPNFTTIYIHIGNTDDDTRGCVLVGKIFDQVQFVLARSTDAYIPLYVKVTQNLLHNVDVKIKIIDLDKINH